MVVDLENNIITGLILLVVLPQDRPQIDLREHRSAGRLRP